MSKVKIKGLVRDRDRHGNERVYLRRNGRKIRIHAVQGSTEFLDEVRAAGLTLEASQTPPLGYRNAKPGTVRALIFAYRESGDFKALGDATKRVRRRILDRLDAAIGDYAARDVTPRHVRVWRDSKEGPEAGNAIVKVLRQVFKLAIEDGELHTNPAAQIGYRRSLNPSGFTPWDSSDVRAFVKHHRPGTMAYKSVMIALMLGQRRGDIFRLGPQHECEREHSRWLVFTQEKNRDRKPIRVEVPISPALRKILDTPQSGHLAYITSEFGRPYKSAQSFGNRFAKWVAEAGMEGRSLHGLRKSAAGTLAELGLTPHEIQAVTGHTTLKEVDRYARGASRRLLAESGYGSLDDKWAKIVEQMQIETVPPTIEDVPPKRNALK